MASLSIFFSYETLQLTSYTTIQGAFFGINLSLYFLCVQLFHRQYCKAPSDQRRKITFSFLYNSLIVLMAALELGAGTRIMQLAYIEHGGTQGEPGEFERKTEDTSSPLWHIFQMTGFVIGTLNSLMQVWRTWVIWSASPFKLVAITVVSILFVGSLSIDIYGESLDTPSKLINIIQAATAALSLAFTITVTLLLVGRIIYVRRRHNRIMGTSCDGANQFTSVIAMLIESYVLDAAWSMASVIAFALTVEGKSYVSELFNDTSDQVTVITFLLVTYRVLLGRAWAPETERQLSTIRWNHDVSQGTTNQATSMDHVPGAPASHV